MAQSGLILVPLLLLSFVTIGQCISSAICTMDTDIRYHATKGRPLGAKWGPDLQQTVVGFETPDRKEDCRNICERKCRGLGRYSWSGCVAFSSQIEEGYSGSCYCFGYTSPPDFGTEVPVSQASHLSGRCVTGWFETDTL
ncbi:uncharacterized protein LOC144650095 [Oculina patagonica]